MTLSNEIIVGKPDLNRDRVLTSKVKSAFVRGTKVCVISPNFKILEKYNEIVSRCKVFEHKGDPNFEVLKDIDAAFDCFLRMGFTTPIDRPSLLVVEDFDRLLTLLNNDERLIHRLNNLIKYSDRQNVSIWIIADSHETLSHSYYKNNLFSNYTRTLLLNKEEFDKTTREDWNDLHKFFHIVEAYKDTEQTTVAI